MTAPPDLVARLREGLDGVTPGPWNRCGGATPKYTAIHAPGHGYVVFGMADATEDREHKSHGPFIKAPGMVEQHKNAAHIALCSPDNIRALLDHIAAQEAALSTLAGERDESRADLARLMDPDLKHLRIEDGSIDLALSGPIVQHMGLVISEHFRASGAENYIEMTYHSKTEPFEAYVWTIQKRVGSNSPHDLRAKADARAEAAEARATTAEAQVVAMREAQTGWLVELKGNTPSWAILFSGDYDDHWTTDSTKALRFSRKIDAEAFIAWHGWTETFASEHIWVDARTALLAGTPPSGAETQEKVDG